MTTLVAMATVHEKKSNDISYETIALSQILETVVTFHFSGGRIYSLNKGCHTCVIKHTMHVQSLHRSIYLSWLDMCIYRPRIHF